MRKINIGIVGCGNISRVYVDNLCNKFHNTHVIALCDLDVNKAKNC